MAKTTNLKRRLGVTLGGLPGVRRKRVRAVLVGSVSDAMTCIRARIAICSADENGAINAWRDDHGVYRAEFQRYMVTRGSLKSTTLKGLRAWLTEWWPKMER